MRLLLSVLVLGLIGTVTAQGFIDEADFPSWAEEAIDQVNDAGVMTGYGDGTFGPDKLLTRAEAVTLIMRVKVDIEDTYNGIPRFPDVVQGAWYDRAIGVAANHGWVKGHDDGQFRPGGTLTRAEFAAMIYRAFDLEVEDTALAAKYDDINENQWFTEPVSGMLENDLLRNALNLNFRPGEEVTRAEAAWTFAQLLNKPGLIGAAGEAQFDATDPLDSRRVAIKPRDFDANNQGYDVARDALYITAEPSSADAPIEFDMTSDWQHLGNVRVTNNIDYRADLESLRVRLRLDRDDMGPEEGFLLQIEGPDFLKQEKVYTNGELAITGLDFMLDPTEEIVLKFSIKADTTESFYMNTATGKVYVMEADGEAYKPLSSDNRQRDVIMAPVEYIGRDLSSFVFEPMAPIEE